jgi:hypothetical protein
VAESLGSSVLDLSVDSSGLDKGLAKAEGDTKSRMGKIGGLIGKAAKAATAAFAAAGTAAIAAAFKTAKYGDEVAKTAPKVGVSTDALQEMAYWADRNGVSSGNLERALGRLNQRIGDGTEGSSKYVDALNDMGVATLDVNGKVRATEDVFTDAIMALQGIEEPSMRSAAAAEIFGTKLARDLMPALQDSALSIDEARKMAQELGLVMDGDALQAAERFQDQWADIKDQIGAFIREAAIPLMTFMGDVVFPMLSNGITILRRVFDAFKDGETAAEGFGDAARMIGDGLGALFRRLLDAVQNVFGNIVTWLTSGGMEMILNSLLAARERMFDAAMKLFPVILDALVMFAIELVHFIGNTMLPRLVDEIVRAVPMLLEAAMKLFNSLVGAIESILPSLVYVLFGVVLPTLLETILDMLPSILDAGVSAFFALLDAIMYVLPELIDTLFGVVLPNILMTILDMMPELLETAVTAFFTLVQAIIDVLPDILGMLFGTVLPAVLRALLQMVPVLLKTALTLFRSIVTGIFQTIPNVMTAIGRVGTAILNVLRGLGSSFFQSGKSIIQSMIDGIGSMIAKVKAKIAELASAVRNLLPFSPAKEGPLSGRGAPDIAGAKIASMVGDGIASGEGDVRMAMERITHMDVDVTAGLGLRGLPMNLGAGAGIVVNVEGAIDQENTARTILRTLRDAERRTGDSLRF